MNAIRAFGKWLKSRDERNKQTPELEVKLPPKPWPELETGPRLAALSDYPSWSPDMHDYIDDLREFECSDAVCCERLLLCIPDERPFRHLTSPRAILDKLELSYNNCIFNGPRHTPSTKLPRSWRENDICQFSCCEGCRSVLTAVDNLISVTFLPDTSRPTIFIREKERSPWIGPGQSALLHVSILWVDKFGYSEPRVFDMVVRNDERWSIPNFSAERLEFATKWFEVCRSKHRCRPADAAFVPRRLIYVGDDHLPPRLIENTGGLQGAEFKYAALSYCWGSGAGTFTTTSNSIEDNKHNIPLYKLPKTIQDAIHICRKLGLLYLWVDALCIIQDTAGHTDWYEQSSQMRQIYSNAQVTIAADDTPECTAGFWHPDRPGFWRIHERCWVKGEQGKGQDILSTRGWTLQERILSHRILHFSSTGISWECDECCRYEDGETKIDFLGLSYRAFRLLSHSTPHERLGTCNEDEDYGEGEHVPTHITDFLTSGSWKSIYFAWATIMENYSGRNLTQPNDKLSAISGLANFVLDERGLGPESYLAGLWKEDLVEGLLWYVSSAQAYRLRSTYIAPTWSWASVTGSIKYFHERYQFRFKSHLAIRDAHCVASQIDPTGRVTAGVICLDGALVQVDLGSVRCHASIKSAYTHSGGTPLRVQGQALAFVRGYADARMAGEKKPRWYEVMFDEEIDGALPGLYHVHDHQDAPTICSPRNPPDGQRMHFCLSVGVFVDSLTGGQRHWFLVLQKTPQAEEAYRRVGIGYFQYRYRKFTLFDQSDMRTISLV